MKLAISTYNYFAIFDTEDRSTKIIDRDRGKYFGITWDNSVLLVSVGVRLNLGEKYGQKTEKILYYDKDLKLKGDLFKRNIGLTNIHQILIKDEILWMVNAGKNRIDKYSFKTKKIKHWYPFILKRGADINHFNSILIRENKLYLVAHNNDKPSEVLVYNYPKIKLIDRFKLGRQSHNIYIEGEDIYVCDSLGTANVISKKGESFSIGQDYVRGLAVSKDKIFVGTSKKASRMERQTGECKIYEFNRKTKALNTIFELEGAGNIYEIRILDDFDYCHYNKPFLMK